MRQVPKSACQLHGWRGITTLGGEGGIVQSYSKTKVYVRMGASLIYNSIGTKDTRQSTDAKSRR